MKRIITTAVQHPWMVVAFLSTMTLLAALSLSRLRIEIAAESMMVNQPELVADYQSNLQTFGSDAITVVYLEDDDLLKPENLAAIRKTLTRIDAIPEISHASSLFSIRYLRMENGFIYTKPYFKPIPESQEAAKQISDVALLNPLIERNLLSRDGTVMAINLYLDMANYHRGFDEAVITALDEAIAPLQRRLRRVFHLGDPSIRADISGLIRHDLSVIMPLAVGVLVVMLWRILSCSRAALIPLITAGFSVIWTLASMALLEIPVNVLTSIIPALLIIVGSTEDIHLISEYHAGIQRGLTPQFSTRYMAGHMGTAILLTFFTTCLGFLSITFNRIDLLQQFGVITAIGLFYNFIITITLVPACLPLLPKKDHRCLALIESHLTRFVEKLFKQLIGNPGVILAGLALLTAVSGFWASRVEVNNNIMAYFPSSSKLPDRAALIDDNLSGIETLSIVITGRDEAFLKVANLRQLTKLQHYLKATGEFDKSISFADFIGVIHGGIDGESPGQVYLPKSDEVVSSYMAMLGQSSAKSFISQDYNQTRIIVRHDIQSSKQLQQAVAGILHYASDSIDPALSVKVTGSSYLNSLAIDYMADGQIRSVIFMLSIIFFVIMLLLSEFKLALVAVFTNLFPIIVLFGVMGLLGIDMDTSSVMVAAIALGICVDHTTHLLVRYRRLTRSCGYIHTKLLQSVKEESLPIITSSLALALGFATLSLSSFPPVARFGMLSALVMLLALVSSFVITPLSLHLLASTRHLQFIRVEAELD